MESTMNFKFTQSTHSQVGMQQQIFYLCRAICAAKDETLFQSHCKVRLLWKTRALTEERVYYLRPFLLDYINNVICEIALNDDFIFSCYWGTAGKFLSKKPLCFLKINFCWCENSLSTVIKLFLSSLKMSSWFNCWKTSGSLQPKFCCSFRNNWLYKPIKLEAKIIECPLHNLFIQVYATCTHQKSMLRAD